MSKFTEITIQSGNAQTDHTDHTDHHVEQQVELINCAFRVTDSRRELYPYQRRALKTMLSNSRVDLTTARQMGKTTLLALYAVGMVLLHRTVDIRAFSGNAASAQDLLHQITSFLPPSLIDRRTKNSITLHANGRIQVDSVSTISHKPVHSWYRGLSFEQAVVLFDEGGFSKEMENLEAIVNDIEYWSMFPTMNHHRNNGTVHAAKIMSLSTAGPHSRVIPHSRRIHIPASERWSSEQLNQFENKLGKAAFDREYGSYCGYKGTQ